MTMPQSCPMLQIFVLLLNGCPQAPGSTKPVTKLYVLQPSLVSPEHVLVPGPNHVWLSIPPLCQSHYIFL